MKHPIIDTNVLVRLLTAQPPEQTERVRTLFKQVDAGEIEPQIPSMVVAEVVYVLQSFYKFDRKDISHLLKSFLGSPGLILENERAIQRALELYRDHNIDFVDAFIAALAEATDSEVISFDADFDKIGSVSRYPIPE